MIDWNKVFEEAHTTSWPIPSVCIQNVNPSPSQGSRNIHAEDRKEIEIAASRHGFRRLGSGKEKIVSYLLSK